MQCCRQPLETAPIGFDNQAINCPARSSSKLCGRPRFASRGASIVNQLPLYLSFLARAPAELGQFEEAWRFIGEAMTAVEITKEKWCEAEVNRTAGEIALMSPQPDAAKAEAY